MNQFIIEIFKYLFTVKRWNLVNGVVRQLF